MKKYTTVYGDLLSPLKQIDFTNIVKRHNGDYRARRLTTLDLLKVGIYGHTTGASGQREIVTSLAANADALYHCGLKKISLSTFSDALAHHDWRIFEKTFYALLSKALLLTNAKNQHFKNPLKLIDSSTIELCLQKCDWAKYQKTKGAIKIHTRIDGDTYLPEQMVITNGNVHDVNLMDHLTRGKGQIFVMDRGYIDFRRLHEIASRHSYYVTRMKKGCSHKVVEVLSESVSESVRFDAKIALTGTKTKVFYPENLRMVKYYDSEKDRDFVYITNNFSLSAQEVADAYKERWQIELFFKWLKQNLKIKSLWGTSENAVKTQIWIALIVYVLLWMHMALITTSIVTHTLLQMLKSRLLTKGSICGLCCVSIRKTSPPHFPPQTSDLFGGVLK